MEMKLGTHACNIISMATSLRKFSLKFLLHFSNSLMVACMEMKLGTHLEMNLGQNAYYIVSMTTTYYFNHNK